MSTIVHVKTISGHERALDIEGFISNAIEPCCYGNCGAVEHAQDYATATAQALGILCRILHEKNVIDNNDLLEIGGGHMYTDVTFEEED